MINNRPLSPHLSIYKKLLTAVFSILHRFTGFVLSIGSILITFWIAIIAFGTRYFFLFEYVSSLIIFKILLFVWTIAIFYHLFNGIRYLFWSYGIGMDLKTVYNSGYIVLLMTTISTLTVWFVL